MYGYESAVSAITGKHTHQNINESCHLSKLLLLCTSNIMVF